MEKKQTTFLISFEKQAHITQEFEALRVKLHDIEFRFFNFEAYLRKAMDEKNKKLQELCHDITQGLIEEKYLKQCFDKNFEKLKSDAKAAEKEQKARISQEIEKSKQLNKQLDNAQVQLEDFTNRATERLLGLSGKVQCLEIEVQTLRDFETNGLQKLENKYLDVTQCHEYFLQEARREASIWKEESDLKQRKCMDLEKRMSQVTKLETENQHLEASMLALKSENERIQKVVATLRLEMESLQDATVEENQRSYRNNTEKQTEMHTAETFQRDLQALKAKISNMSSKLDGIDVYIPTTKKRTSILHGSTARVKNSSDILSSDEDMPSRLAELEQTQIILKAQLEATVANAARIADERDILMELNNSLHADLNRTIHCSCASRHYHGNEDKRRHDEVCCLEPNWAEQNRGQNSGMHCCSSWIRGTEPSGHKECCNATCSSLSKPSVQEQNISAKKNKLHIEGTTAKYHDRMTASEVITHKVPSLWQKLTV
ncbi:hypothetical protein L7F22_025727 [Adiantum nelumboides]|nr:hypothetical protein [Adiantum nelumboides]